MFLYRCLGRRGLRLVVSRTRVEMRGHSLARTTVTEGDSMQRDPADLPARLFADLGGRDGRLVVDASQCELVERDASVDVIVSVQPSVKYVLEFDRVGGVSGSRIEHLRAMDGFLGAVVQKA